MTLEFVSILLRFVIPYFVLFLRDMVNKPQTKKVSCSGLLTVYLAWEISRIPEAVATAQIIHGDVKPDNFMIVQGSAFFCCFSFLLLLFIFLRGFSVFFTTFTLFLLNYLHNRFED